MTTILLALVFSNAALAAAEANDAQDGAGAAAPRPSPTISARAWHPDVDNWDDERSECPIFFQQHVDGFGIVRIGARCADDDYPHAL